MKFSMPRLRIAIAVIMLVGMMSLFFATQNVQAANITWDGGGVTNNWSEDANWSGDVEPGASDVAVFDGTSTKAATIDASINVQGIDINAGYSGTITQAAGATVTVGSGDFDISSGTFTGSNATITVNDDFVVSGGTFTGGSGSIDLNDIFTLSSGAFTSTSGTMTVAGAFTHTAGGTFTHNSGTVTFDGGSATIDVSTTESFNHLTIDSTGTKTVSSGDTLTANGTLTLTNGNINTGTVDAKSDITHGAGFDGGNGTITVTGGSSDINLTASGQLPSLNVSVARNVNGPASGEVDFDGSLTQAAGAFVGSAGNVDIAGSLTISGATTTFTAPSGTLFIGLNFVETGLDNDADTLPEAGDFVPNGGTVTFDGSGSFNLETSGINVTESFNNVTVALSSDSSVVSVQAGDVLRVDGTLTLTNGNFTTGTGGSVDAYADITHGAAFDGGSGLLRIQGGSSDINLTAGGSLSATTLNVARNINGNASGTVTIDGDFTIAAGAFVGGAGTIDMTTGVDVIIAGGAFTAPASLLASGEFTHTSGTFSHNNGSITFDGSATRAIDLPTTDTFNDVTFNASGAGYSIAANDTMVIIGDLALTNGSILLAGSGATVNFTGTSITHASTYDGGDVPITVAAGVTLTPSYTASHTSFVNPLVINHASAVLAGPASALDTLTVEGNLTLTNGTINNGAGTITFTGTLTKTGGTFNGDTGTILLSSTTDATISGAFTFYNLVGFPSFSGVVYTLPAGVTTGITNSIKIASDSHSDLATLESSGGSQATIDFDGDPEFASFFNVSFQNINFSAVDPALCLVHCRNGGNVTNVDFAETVQVSELSGITSETGSTFDFTVVLSHAPESDVTVPLSSTDTTEATVNPTSLTFTTANWDSPQSVTVTGVSDTADDGAVAYTITLGAATSADSDYSGLNPSDVSGKTLDDDTAAGVFDFDVDTQYLHENVLGSVETYETSDDFGYVSLGDGTFTPLNISTSKILAGCRVIDDAASTYSIVNIKDATTGQVVLSEIPDEEPINFPAVSDTLASITCTSSDGNTVGPIVDSIMKSLGIASMTGEQIIYEPAGDDLWVSYDSGAPQGLVRYDISTGAQDPFSVGGLSPIDFTMDDEATRTKMWAIDGSTDQLASVTFAGVSAGPFATNAEPEVIAFSNNNDGDAGNDAVWVGYDFVSGQPARITKYDADTGNPFDTDLATSTYTVDQSSTTSYVTAILYEEGDNALWVATSNNHLVKINPATGAPANGSLANSTYRIPVETDRLYYDSVRDVIWFGGTHASVANNDVDLDVYRFDTDSGIVTGATRSDAESNLAESFHLDTGSNVLYAFDFTGSVFGFNPSTLATVSFNTLLGGGATVTGLNPSPFFGLSYHTRLGGIDGGLYQRSNTFASATYPLGAADSEYYSVISANAAQQNVTSWTDIVSAAVTEDVDSQLITYAVSFDGRQSFKVYAAGWRTVASNLASDTGLADGTWAYRNDANTWAAAAVNSAQNALSLAVENGPTLNQMTGTEMEALVEANWEAAGGFNAASTTTLDLGATFFTDDPTEHPSVDEVAFTFSGSAGAGVTVSPISQNTTESGGSGTFTVVLDTLPTGNVEIDSVSNDLTEGQVTINSTLTFTTGNWNVPQTVTVTGIDDVADDGDIPYSILVTVDAGNTADADYDAVDPDDVAVVNIDNDASGGGGGGSVTPSGVHVTNTEVVIERGSICSRNPEEVTLKLRASSANQVLVSNDPDFLDAEWQTFVVDETEPVTFGTDNERIFTMTLDWTLQPNDLGVGTVYAKFRSSGGNTTGEKFDSAQVVPEEGECSIDYLSISEVEVCAVDKADVTLTVRSDADDVEFMVSNNRDFVGAEWQEFEQAADVPLEWAPDGGRMYTMYVPWTLEEDSSGMGTVYLKLRRSTGDESGVISESVVLTDPAVDCVPRPPGQEEADDEAPTLPLPCRIVTSPQTRPDEDDAPSQQTRPEDEDAPSQQTRPEDDEAPSQQTRPEDEGGSQQTRPEDEEEDAPSQQTRPEDDEDAPSQQTRPEDEEDAPSQQTRPEDEGEGSQQTRPDEDGEGSQQTRPDEEELPPCQPAIEGARAGDFVRTSQSSTVFYIGPDNTIYPFPDLQTYLTYADQCTAVTYVEGAALSLGTLGPPMLPNAGVVLVKFPGDSKVYAVEDYPDSVQRKTLRWIPDEETAIALYGADWADYVVEVKPEQIPFFEFGDEMTEEDQPDLHQLRNRAALNNAVTYDLYIVNPDGTERHAYSDFGRVENIGQGLFRFMFEDSGRDSDFNDVVMEVDPRACLDLQFTVLPLESLWQHQIGVEIYYDNELKDDLILWENSHAAVDTITVVDVSNASLIRQNVRYVVKEETVEAQSINQQVTDTLQLVGEIIKRPFTIR